MRMLFLFKLVDLKHFVSAKKSKRTKMIHLLSLNSKKISFKLNIHKRINLLLHLGIKVICPKIMSQTYLMSTLNYACGK